MMAAGFKAVLVCLDPKKMPASLAGRVWDEQLLSELPADVDPCGEVRRGSGGCEGMFVNTRAAIVLAAVSAIG